MRESGSFLLVALLCLATVSASAQKRSIRIQFINGKNGKPLSNRGVVVNLNESLPMKQHLSTSVLRTDENGMVIVQAGPGEQIMANPERSFGRNCQTNGRYGKSHETVEIIEHGVVEENHCGAGLPSAKPGLLIVAFRRETFLEALGDD